MLLSRYEDVLWALRHPEAFTNETASASATSRCCRSRSIRRCTPATAGSSTRSSCRGRSSSSRPTSGAGRRADRRRSPTAARATSTRSSPRRCRRASSSYADGLARGRPPDVLPVAGQHDPPDVEPGDNEGALGSARRHGHAISDYFRERIAERLAEPDDTLLSKIVHATIDGRPSTRRSCSASATCSAAVGSTPSRPRSTA